MVEMEVESVKRVSLGTGRYNSEIYCPLPALSKILLRSSDHGELPKLILLSTVSRNFAEAVREVSALTLSRSSLPKSWFSRDGKCVLTEW